MFSQDLDDAAHCEHSLVRGSRQRAQLAAGGESLFGVTVEVSEVPVAVAVVIEAIRSPAEMLQLEGQVQRRTRKVRSQTGSVAETPTKCWPGSTRQLALGHVRHQCIKFVVAKVRRSRERPALRQLDHHLRKPSSPAAITGPPGLDVMADR